MLNICMRDSLSLVLEKCTSIVTKLLFSFRRDIPLRSSRLQYLLNRQMEHQTSFRYVCLLEIISCSDKIETYEIAIDHITGFLPKYFISQRLKHVWLIIQFKVYFTNIS